MTYGMPRVSHRGLLLEACGFDRRERRRPRRQHGSSHRRFFTIAILARRYYQCQRAIFVFDDAAYWGQRPRR